MQVAGRPSWALDVGDDEQLELALFIRDAAGLVVAGDGVPPPLLDRPPVAEVLADHDPTDVGKDWLVWWRALVGVRAWVTEHHLHREAAGSLSDGFAGLANALALRADRTDHGHHVHTDFVC